MIKGMEYKYYYFDFNYKYSKSIDLWSIGVVLYECFTGFHPF